MSRFSRRSLAAGAALAWALAAAPAAYAQATYSFNMPAQDLGRSLRTVARRTGSNVVFEPASVRGRTAPALHGNFSADQAIERLLAGSGLSGRRTSGGSWVVAASGAASEPGETEAAGAAADSEGAAITVTGSRIRGAPPASPVIEITAEEMRNAGHTDLGEVARSIPQNFAGGQNPQIGQDVPSASNDTSGSNLNLRGLGPSATLTLLNGRRLAYGGVNQGVDISAIPIAAVDRIEIVADGSSALYGSDAVGGVANIILRRNYDGVSVSGRIGTATDGGFSRQQLSVTAGRTWGSGSILFGGDFNRSTKVFAGDRSYTSNLHPSATLYPYIRGFGGLLSARQEIWSGSTLSVDTLYNRRVSETTYPNTVAADYRTSGVFNRPLSQTFVVSPNLEVPLPSGWRATFGGTYARETNDIDSEFYSGGVRVLTARTGFRNVTRVAEANAEGPLFALSGGNVRLALGGGYREVNFQRSSVRNTVGQRTISGSRNSLYGYGELFVPLVSPSQEISGVDRLSVSAAVRYEDYPGIAEVATPRFGITYAPIADITFGATWGRSFKTPTLFEQFQDQLTVLWPAAVVGGVGFPATATALFQGGGRPSLRPERSTNWTASLAVQPRSIEGLRVEASYFSINYTDRIAVPNAFATALSSPLFAQFLTLSPTQAQIDQAIADATAGLINPFGLVYNPTNVVAIFDGRLTNISRQRIQGVDIAVQYRTDLGGDNSIAAFANASWLRSNRLISEGQPVTPLAGTIFNPPNWRARAGLTWDTPTFAISSHVNFIGALKDIRTTTTSRIGSQATFDVYGVYRIRPFAFTSGIELSLSVLNVFNAKPERIVTASPVSTPFDSTNFSPIGRTITFAFTAAF